MLYLTSEETHNSRRKAEAVRLLRYSDGVSVPLQIERCGGSISRDCRTHMAPPKAG